MEFIHGKSLYFRSFVTKQKRRKLAFAPKYSSSHPNITLIFVFSSFYCEGKRRKCASFLYYGVEKDEQTTIIVVSRSLCINFIVISVFRAEKKEEDENAKIIVCYFITN